MRSLDYNSVVIFKQQGTKQSDNIDNMADNAFILEIQTHFQRDVMMKFGNDTVCMDSTHGTNMYDFNLITFLVVDEYGEGVPVAWMIANREDPVILIEFLTALKQRTGDLKPTWFMMTQNSITMPGLEYSDVTTHGSYCVHGTSTEPGETLQEPTITSPDISPPETSAK